jgi:RNA polymerase sigma-70 factor (ECF subfamily)
MATPRDNIPGPSLDLEELVKEHAGLLFRLARRLSGCPADAEDLVQQTFLAAQAHGDQLREPQKVRGWLCTILRNEFFKVARSRQRSKTVSLDVIPEITHTNHNDNDIDAEAIQLALDSLPETFRVPIVLYYFHDMSYRDIAESLGLPIGTVMSRLARGKARLRDRLPNLIPQTSHIPTPDHIPNSRQPITQRTHQTAAKRR